MLPVGCVLMLSLAIFQVSGFLRVAAVVTEFKALTTQDGINFLKHSGLERVLYKIQDWTVPDFKGSYSPLYFDEFSYDVRNVRITSYSIPTASLTTNPSAGGLRLTTSGISLSVYGDWRYKYSFYFKLFSDSGYFDAHVSSTSLKLSLRFGVDTDGSPTISSTTCSFHIERMKVDLHGWASNFYNTNWFGYGSIVDYITLKIKKSVNEEVCPELLKTIDIDLKKNLKTLKLEALSLRVAGTDYALAALPVVNVSIFNVLVKTAHKSAKPPVEESRISATSATLVGEFSPHAILPDKTLAYLFTIKVSITATEFGVSLKGNGNRPTWFLSSFSTEFSLVKTEDGWFSGTFLETAGNSAIKHSLLPRIN
ncbi:bactericidal permeability-increasing protein-like, partial [Diadema antillarum]|uniref:bactericidal permeability-increasing protein-like n=1 Tax=Diadema antillarum TaxID=105358 RepID=UPI003A863695